MRNSAGTPSSSKIPGQTDADPPDLPGYGGIQSAVLYNGTYANGIVLSDPQTQNPALIGQSGYVFNNGDAVLGQAGTAWTVVNNGRIATHGTRGYGIHLLAGGYVSNAAGATISGSPDGVVIDAAAGSVANAGTIAGSGTGGFGVGIYLEFGGGVSNAVGGVVRGTFDGIVCDGNASIANSGTIVDTGTKGVGVGLVHGGTVLNAAGAYLGGGSDAVVLFGGVTAPAAGSLLNHGTIRSGAPDGEGVLIAAFGLIDNYRDGLISGVDYGVVGFAAAASLLNAGTIVADGGRRSMAIDPAPSGVVTNTAGGIIAGGIGIDLADGLTVFTAGTVSGSSGDAVIFDDGNGLLVIQPGARFDGAIGDFQSGDRIVLAGVSATGYAFSGGVLTLFNGATQVARLPLLTPYAAPTFTLSPTGGGTQITVASRGSGLVLSGIYPHGLFFDDPMTQSPATVTATGYVATNGLAIRAVGSLANLGMIAGFGTNGVGVFFGAGGTLVNGHADAPTALVSGSETGVYLTGGTSAVLTNFGTIAGGIGVFASAYDTASNTVVNAGTIIGTAGDALQFGPGGGRLVVNPGADFIGMVAGGTGGGLELAPGQGVLSGLGSSFTGFASVTVDAGAAWRLSGNGPAFIDDGTIAVAGGRLVLGPVAADKGASGTIAISGGGLAEFSGAVDAAQIVTFAGSGTARLDQPTGFGGAVAGFEAGDTLDLAGLVATGASLSGGVLSLTSGGAVVAQLRLSTPYATPDFMLAADGAGGTAITVTPAMPPPPPPPPANLALAPGSDSSHGADVTNVAQPVVNGTGAPGDSVTLSADGVAVGSGKVGSDGNWSVMSMPLSEGPHSLSATETDPATGLVSGASASLAITIKTSAPAPSTPQLLGGGTITSSPTPTLTGTGEAGDALTVFDSGTAVGTGTVGAAGSWTITTSPLPDGMDMLTASETDIAGNVSPASPVFDLTVATTVPPPANLALAPGSDSSHGADVTNVAQPVVSGTGAPGDSVTLSADGVAVGSGKVGSDGNWSVMSMPLSEGPHSLSATETDPATGLVSGASASLAITIKTSAPAPSTPQLLGGGTLTVGSTPAIVGSGEAGDTVTLFDDAAVVGTGVVGASGSWTITTAPLPGGVNLLSATETDIAGNVSGPSAGFDLTVLSKVLAGTYGSSIPLAEPATQNPTTVTATGVIATGSGDAILDTVGYHWTIANFGSIAAAGAGIRLPAGGAVANYGAISGSTYGLALGADSTVTNAGTIGGGSGVAVEFAGGGDLLVVAPGAVFNGVVTAAGSGNTLELAAGSGGGVLTGLGANYSGFATLKVDAGASWTVSGIAGDVVNDGTITASRALVFGAITQDPGAHGLIELGGGAVVEIAGAAASPQRLMFTDGGGTLVLDDPGQFRGRITGFGAGDTIDLTGIAADGLRYASGKLTLTENGRAVARLHVLGDNPAGFMLSPDGTGGTDITLAAPQASLGDFWSPRGV